MRTPFSHLYIFFKNERALAIGIVFFLQSAVFAAWLVHIPSVKNRLDLSEGDLGSVLFALPIGLLVMNPVTGWITGRYGAVRTTIFSLVTMLGSIWLPVFAWNQRVLFVSLFLLGLSAALINVSMNTCATLIEKSENIRILSTCHGLWSVGNLVCSGLMAVAIARNLEVFWRFSALSVIVVCVLFFLRKKLKTIAEPTQQAATKSKFVLPNFKLFLLIIIGISVTMGEGLAFDWSGVYMRDVAKAPASVAAFGLSAFAALMALVRLLGDWILTQFSGLRLLLFGGLFAALGVGICIAFPNPFSCFVGLMCIGGGVALGSPILYAASMRIEGVSPSAGLATFASLSFLGFLLAPPLIGFLGEHFGLKVAFGCIGGLLVLGALTSLIVDSKQASK